MLKILLVYDDFQELTSVELMLKKIGFDVVGITSEFSLSEQLLAFNPQVIVAQGHSPKVSSAGVGKRLRESVRWDGQSILIFYPNSKPQPTDILKMRMDVGLEYPVEPTKLVQVLAQLGGLDANQLLDKLIKNISHESTSQGGHSGPGIGGRQHDEATYVSGGKQQADPSVSFNVERLADEAVGLGKGANGDGVDVGSAVQFGSDVEEGVGSPLELSSSASVIENPVAKEVGSSGSLFPGPAVTGDEPSYSRSTDRDSRRKSSATESENDAQTISSQPEEKKLFDIPQVKDPIMQELEGLLKQSKDKKEVVVPLIQDPKRAEKYTHILGNLPVLELSAINRREAKKRMRDMIRNVSKESMRDQDDLRREFVKALFKRKS